MNNEDFVFFSAYRYFELNKEPSNINNKEQRTKLIAESLINGLKEEIDKDFIKNNLNKTFIITAEESYANKSSLSFDLFKKMALNLKIIQHNENNLVVKIIQENTIETIFALMENPTIYNDEIFLFKMYPVSI